MEVHINDYPIDFVLENEKTVIDVINSISEWSNQRNLIFSEAFINGTKYYIDDMPDIDIENVEQINCVVQSRADVVLKSMDEAARYCEKATNFINKSLENNSFDKTEVINLSGGIDWLVEVFLKVIQLVDLDIETLKYKDKEVHDYIRDLKNFKDKMERVNVSNMIDFFNQNKNVFLNMKNIFRMLLLTDEMKKLIIHSIDSPDVLMASLKSIKDELSEQLHNIEETAVAFQTGKDIAASGKLDRFIDFVYRYTRTCYSAAPVFGLDLSQIEVNGITLDNKIRNLMNLLHETISIMENNDIISLTDILEYEIKPSLEDIDLYIDKLIIQITGS